MHISNLGKNHILTPIIFIFNTLDTFFLNLVQNGIDLKGFYIEIVIKLTCTYCSCVPDNNLMIKIS